MHRAAGIGGLSVPDEVLGAIIAISGLPYATRVDQVFRALRQANFSLGQVRVANPLTIKGNQFKNVSVAHKAELLILG